MILKQIEKKSQVKKKILKKKDTEVIEPRNIVPQTNNTLNRLSNTVKMTENRIMKCGGKSM